MNLLVGETIAEVEPHTEIRLRGQLHHRVEQAVAIHVLEAAPRLIHRSREPGGYPPTDDTETHAQVDRSSEASVARVIEPA